MPRNCVILGCGRSGTSLAAGIVAGGRYRAGHRLLAPDERNPRGFFEDEEVNAINEELLAPHATVPAGDGYSRPPGPGERWLVALPADVDIRASCELRERIARNLDAEPWCRKDPRFCYTLPAWRPLLGNPVFVCVFREPARTAHSISGEVRYGDLRLSFEAALRVWTAMYRQVLERHVREGDWVFVHYDDLLAGHGVDVLEEALGSVLDRSAADPALRRSPAVGDVPPETRRVYGELCAAAGR